LSDYVARHLLSGERIVFSTRRHWVMFIGPALIVLAGLIAALLPVAADLAPLWSAPGGVLILFGIAMVIARSVRFLSSEFVVTNMRVVMKEGLLARRSDEILLQKIETIGVDQSLSGRLLGYGTLTVTGTGGAREPFQDVNDPIGFRRAVQEQSIQK